MLAVRAVCRKKFFSLQIQVRDEDGLRIKERLLSSYTFISGSSRQLETPAVSFPGALEMLAHAGQLGPF